MWLIVVLTVLLAVCLHYLLIAPLGHWKRKGIPGPKPYPFVGNMGQNFILTKTMAELFQDIYNDYKDCLYVGVFKASKPAVLVRDPDLIKEVLVKSFNSFHDNDFECDEKQEPIFSRNPFCLRGHKWKVVRGQVTANITTGKIKAMYYLMLNVGKNLVEYLKKTPEAKGEEGLEVKELAAKFTTDVVAACAFGLEGKSFIDPNSEFRNMGRKFLHPGAWVQIKSLIIFFFPSLTKFLRVRLLTDEVEAWFTNTLLQAINYRKENKIVRNDYLDMMLALKDKPGEYEFQDIDVIAQCMTFYVDGFETSSIELSFTLYEIAANPEIQAKLKQEIDTVLAKHGGEINYDSIMDMHYLDMVLSEGLRKYPAGGSLFKKCTEPFRFPPVKTDGTGPHLDLKPDDSVIIPIHAIHRDPQYYPDPDKFDPERFSEAGKQSRPKMCYMPFSEGPRQCLGYRFALAQIKAALVSILKEFEVKVNPKTQVPIVMDPNYFMLAAKGGLWLNFYKRDK